MQISSMRCYVYNLKMEDLLTLRMRNLPTRLENEKKQHALGPVTKRQHEKHVTWSTLLSGKHCSDNFDDTEHQDDAADTNFYNEHQAVTQIMTYLHEILGYSNVLRTQIPETVAVWSQWRTERNQPDPETPELELDEPVPRLMTELYRRGKTGKRFIFS